MLKLIFVATLRVDGFCPILKTDIYAHKFKKWSK